MEHSQTHYPTNKMEIRQVVLQREENIRQHKGILTLTSGGYLGISHLQPFGQKEPQFFPHNITKKHLMIKHIKQVSALYLINYVQVL